MSGKFTNLLQPGNIGKVQIKNRMVMSPMGNRLCGIWGEVTDSLVEWYRRRAMGGCGLIITEATLAATAIDPYRILPRQLRVDDTSYIAGLARIAEAIQENGARAALQLQPGGGVQAKHGPWTPGIQKVIEMEQISPSGVPSPGHPGKPRILSVEEIKKLEELCAFSAWNAQRAGFDIVEIAAHGGCIIAQFMSPYFNKRTDEYGGSFENRCRFFMEMIAITRKKVGNDYPLMVKYSIEDNLPNGWDVKQSQALARMLEEAGISGIEISSGMLSPTSPKDEVKGPPISPPYFFPKGIFVQYAEAIKEAVKIPVLVGGRLNDPSMAEQVLKDGKADFICEARAVIADSDWPNKVAGGRTEDIRPCLACNECLQSMVINYRSVRCSVNAAAGRELEIGQVKPAEVKKKVLVVGGGPAGMEAARIAALRGHQVTLCEKHRQLGGLMLLGGVHNEQISEFAEWQANQVRSLPVDVKLNTEVMPSLVAELKPDAVILANGGTFQKPDIPGIARDNVFSAQDLLNLMNGVPVNKGILFSSLLPLAKKAITAATVRQFLGSNFPIKKNVAIIGGQFPGCCLALALAERGKQVTVIEEAEVPGKDVETNTMVGLNGHVRAGEVKMLTSSRAVEINNKGIVVADSQGNQTLYEADTVIVALELAPSNSNLGSELRGKVKELYTIGDAKYFQRIRKAVTEGYITAFSL